MFKKILILTSIALSFLMAVCVGANFFSNGVEIVNASDCYPLLDVPSPSDEDWTTCTYCEGTGTYSSEKCPVCHGEGGYDSSVASKTYTFSCSFSSSSGHSGYAVLNGVKQTSNSFKIGVGDKIDIYSSYGDYASIWLTGVSDFAGGETYELEGRDIAYEEGDGLVPSMGVYKNCTVLIVAPEVEKEYDVTFVLFDNSVQVTRAMSTITQEVCDSLWAEWRAAYSDLDLTEKYWFVIQNSGISYGSSLPFTVDTTGYVVVMESLFPVTFVFPYGSTVVERLDYVTQSIIDDVWTEWSDSNDYSWGYSSVIAFDGLDGSPVPLEFPLTVVYSNLCICYSPYSSKVTFDLNLPEGVIGYGVGEIAENGDYNDVSVMYDLASAISYGSSIENTSVLNCASVVGIGCYALWDILSEQCPFLGWALSPSAGIDDIVIPASFFKEQIIEGTSYVNLVPDTSKDGGVIYIHQETTFYAVYGSVVYNITYECNGGELVGDYSDTWSLGQTLKLPDATKNDYLFRNWYYDSTFNSVCNPSEGVDLSYADDNHLIRLYACYTRIGLNFCYLNPDGGVTYIDSSLNSVPVHYSVAPTVTIEGFPFVSTLNGGEEVAYYSLESGQTFGSLMILFYPFSVKVYLWNAISMPLFLSTYGNDTLRFNDTYLKGSYSYPFTFSLSDYGFSVDSSYDIKAYCIDTSEPVDSDPTQYSTLDLYGLSYRHTASDSYSCVKYYLGRCRLANNPLISEKYSLSYILGLADMPDSYYASLSGGYKLFRYSNSTLGIQESKAESDEDPYTMGALSLYMNDEVTLQYIDKYEIDTELVGDLPDKNAEDDLLSRLTSFLTLLFEVVIFAFVAFFVLKMFFLK